MDTQVGIAHTKETDVPFGIARDDLLSVAGPLRRVNGVGAFVFCHQHQLGGGGQISEDLDFPASAIRQARQQHGARGIPAQGLYASGFMQADHGAERGPVESIQANPVGFEIDEGMREADGKSVAGWMPIKGRHIRPDKGLVKNEAISNGIQLIDCQFVGG